MEATQRRAKHPFSFRIRRDEDQTICATDLDKAHVYPVRVFTPSGRFKKTISVKTLTTRPIEEGKYDI